MHLLPLPSVPSDPPQNAPVPARTGGLHRRFTRLLEAALSFLFSPEEHTTASSSAGQRSSEAAPPQEMTKEADLSLATLPAEQDPEHRHTQSTIPWPIPALPGMPPAEPAADATPQTDAAASDSTSALLSDATGRSATSASPPLRGAEEAAAIDKQPPQTVRLSDTNAPSQASEAAPAPSVGNRTMQAQHNTPFSTLWQPNPPDPTSTIHLTTHSVPPASHTANQPTSEATLTDTVQQQHTAIPEANIPAQPLRITAARFDPASESQSARAPSSQFNPATGSAVRSVHPAFPLETLSYAATGADNRPPQPGASDKADGKSTPALQPRSEKAAAFPVVEISSDPTPAQIGSAAPQTRRFHHTRIQPVGLSSERIHPGISGQPAAADAMLRLPLATPSGPEAPSNEATHTPDSSPEKPTATSVQPSAFDLDAPASGPSPSREQDLEPNAQLEAAPALDKTDRPAGASVHAAALPTQTAALPRVIRTAAWFQMAMAFAERVRQHFDGQMLEVELAEGEGMLRVETRRHPDHIAVSVQLSDPQLRALVAAHAERIQEALQAQYQTAVQFSLSGGGEQPGRQQQTFARAPAHGTPLASPSEASDTAPVESPRHRILHPGSHHEWIG